MIVINSHGICTRVAGISTSDFSLSTLSLNLTPKGMTNRDVVMDLVWQWINLIKEKILNDDELMAKYHDELVQMSTTFFRYRENGDPTDFCSSAAEMLFDYQPDKLLLGSSAKATKYNPEVTKEYLKRFTPENSMITIFCSDAEAEAGTSSGVLSATSSEWQSEKWYSAKYREMKIKSSLEEWANLSDTDPRLQLPALNNFLPTDFSLRSEDADVTTDPDVDYSKENPKLLIDRDGIKLWHKMDRTFKVPKTSIMLHLVTPDVYQSPRSMTYCRLFTKVLEDDLNSYIYDGKLTVIFLPLHSDIVEVANLMLLCLILS